MLQSPLSDFQVFPSAGKLRAVRPSKQKSDQRCELKNVANLLLEALRKQIWRMVLLVLVATGVCSAPSHANAVKLLGNRCDFTPQELADPDQVLTLTLTGERFCSGISVGEDLYGTVVLPKVGRWPKVHPEKAIAKLLDRYGVPKNEPFEPWGGTFREFKVLDKSQRAAIEGHEAIEYTVELLYVKLDGWQHKPKTDKYGSVSVCERNVVSVMVINYQGGWYVNKPRGIGNSTSYEIRTTRIRNWDRQHIERDIANDKKISDRCKDHLN